MAAPQGGTSTRYVLILTLEPDGFPLRVVGSSNQRTERVPVYFQEGRLSHRENKLTMKITYNFDTSSSVNWTTAALELPSLARVGHFEKVPLSNIFSIRLIVEFCMLCNPKRVRRSDNHRVCWSAPRAMQIQFYHLLPILYSEPTRVSFTTCGYQVFLWLNAHFCFVSFQISCNVKHAGISVVAMIVFKHPYR